MPIAEIPVSSRRFPLKYPSGSNEIQFTIFMSKDRAVRLKKLNKLPPFYRPSIDIKINILEIKDSKLIEIL